MAEQQPSGAPQHSEHAPDPMRLERHQPDPMLQLSAGRLNGAGVWLVGIAVAVILAVVLYGLNGPSGEKATQSASHTAPAATNSGAPNG